MVFGLARFYPLSLAALAALVVSGFVDLYSMNIRSTTVAPAEVDRLEQARPSADAAPVATPA